MAATSDRGWTKRLVAVGAPVDRGDRRPDVAELVEQSRRADEDQGDRANHSLVEQRPEEPDTDARELDLSEQDQDAVHDRRGAAEGREDHDQQDRNGQQECADGEQGAQDQADHDRYHAGPETEVFEEADTQRVADRAGEDDDRSVVPEVRDGREDQAEDQADPPGQDRREEALAEDIGGPLGAGDEAEEERPDGPQDRKQREPVEGPGGTDDDRQ